MAGQHGNRMLELRPLHADADKLRASPFQLSLRRHHVGFRHGARSVLVLHNLQGVFKRRDSIL
jgi:hypothetical protein